MKALHKAEVDVFCPLNSQGWSRRPGHRGWCDLRLHGECLSTPVTRRPGAEVGPNREGGAQVASVHRMHRMAVLMS